MPTPEETIALLEKQLEEHKAKGADYEALQSKVNSLSEQNAKIIEDGKKKDLDIARTQALSEFPAAKGMPELILGNTPEEIKASAKSLHEKLSARDKALMEKHGVKESAGLDAWSGVPGSTPPEFMMDPNRQEQYAKLRAEKIPTRMKIAGMMKMKMEDLHKNFTIAARRALGVR